LLPLIEWNVETDDTYIRIFHSFSLQELRQMNLELGKFSDDPDKNMEVLREIGDI
jgi:Fe-S-cluster formation regulator IscX/YfhJ